MRTIKLVLLISFLHLPDNYTQWHWQNSITANYQNLHIESSIGPILLYDESDAMKFVTLKIYDALGIEIATVVNEERPAGYYEVEFVRNIIKPSRLKICKLLK